MERLKRIEHAAEEAELKFWEMVADIFPTAVAGDMDPVSAHKFSETCKEMVTAWVRYNVPLTLAELDWRKLGRDLRKQTDEAHNGMTVRCEMAYSFMLNNAECFLEAVYDEWPAGMPEQPPVELVLAYYEDVHLLCGHCRKVPPTTEVQACMVCDACAAAVQRVLRSEGVCAKCRGHIGDAERTVGGRRFHEDCYNATFNKAGRDWECHLCTWMNYSIRSRCRNCDSLRRAVEPIAIPLDGGAL